CTGACPPHDPGGPRVPRVTGVCQSQWGLAARASHGVPRTLGGAAQWGTRTGRRYVRDFSGRPRRHHSPPAHQGGLMPLVFADGRYESGPDLPSILGLHGCLERARFAFDPATDTFYFGPAFATV